MNTANLLKSLDTLAQPRVLVIGDLILDEYIEGEVERISREAPVPVVIAQRHDYKPGGAANTLVNITSMGASATAIGVVGNDNFGLQLKQLLQEAKIQTEAICTVEEVTTTTKTRISAQSRQSVMQQVLRLDHLPEQKLNSDAIQQLKQQIQQEVKNHDIVIVSDYGNGVIVPELIEVVRQEAQAAQIPWIVDSQEDLRLFHGASLLTPNQPEAENNLGYQINNQETLLKAGKTLLQETGAQALLITRGDEGMSLFEASGDYHEVSALNRAAVFDVTGAGDTVVATLAVAMGSGCNKQQAMLLANLAASIVIRRHGCSTTHPQEMRDTLLEMHKKEGNFHD